MRESSPTGARSIHKILITDGDQRSTLAATRALGRKGYWVVVTGKEKHSLASRSKYCRRNFQTPDPLANRFEYACQTIEIAKKAAVDLILPMTDHTITALNEIRQSIPEDTTLACPPQAIVDTIVDKAKLFRLAVELNVPVPASIHVDRPEDLRRQADRIRSYPVVIKPSLSKIPLGKGFLSAGVRYAHSRRDLEQLYATSKALQHPSIIQEKIVGPGTGLFTLFDGRRHLALFSHRRIWEKPPGGGVSVISQSVSLDNDMVEASARLLSAVGWKGVAMVEFKRDRRDDRAKLMEINGRLWGTLQLAISSGVDFPCLLLDYISGNPIDSALAAYRENLRMKWLLGSLDHLLIRMTRSNGKPEAAENRLDNLPPIKEFWKNGGAPTVYDVYDPRDIRPFLQELTGYFRQVAKR